VLLIKSIELLRRQLSITQQFEASALYTVVRWRKLGHMRWTMSTPYIILSS